MDKKEKIDELIDLEWYAFTKVENEGGRAYCQDDWETFYLMRMSQYICWPENLIESFTQDLIDANKREWNLVAEKYARMEEFTAPEEYESIKGLLPEVSEEQKALIDEIVDAHNQWMDEFYSANPNMAERGRPLHTSVDGGMTSAETYLRGELGTYSYRTLSIYAQWVRELKANGENLTEQIVSNEARLYGYESIKEVH